MPWPSLDWEGCIKLFSLALLNRRSATEVCFQYSQQQETNKTTNGFVVSSEQCQSSADRKRPTKMPTDNRLSLPKRLLQEKVVVKRKGNELAIIACGCFRYPQAVYQQVPGVHSVVAGYTTTTNSPATTWCCGESSNILLKDNSSTQQQQQRFSKALLIEFDPHLITYYQLLEIWHSVVDVYFAELHSDKLVRYIVSSKNDGKRGGYLFQSSSSSSSSLLPSATPTTNTTDRSSSLSLVIRNNIGLFPTTKYQFGQAVRYVKYQTQIGKSYWCTTTNNNIAIIPTNKFCQAAKEEDEEFNHIKQQKQKGRRTTSQKKRNKNETSQLHLLQEELQQRPRDDTNTTDRSDIKKSCGVDGHYDQNCSSRSLWTMFFQQRRRRHLKQRSSHLHNREQHILNENIYLMSRAIVVQQPPATRQPDDMCQFLKELELSIIAQEDKEENCLQDDVHGTVTTTISPMSVPTPSSRVVVARDVVTDDKGNNNNFNNNPPVVETKKRRNYYTPPKPLWQ